MMYFPMPGVTWFGPSGWLCFFQMEIDLLAFRVRPHRYVWY